MTMPDASLDIDNELERQVHNLLSDLGLIEQRMDEFVDQQAMVNEFLKRWNEVVFDIRDDVLRQIAVGKRKIELR